MTELFLFYFPDMLVSSERYDLNLWGTSHWNRRTDIGTLITFLLYMETLWGNLRVSVNIVDTSAPSHTHTHTYRMKFLSFSFQTLVQWQGREFFKTLLKLETFFEYFERKSKLKTSGKETKENWSSKAFHSNILQGQTVKF